MISVPLSEAYAFDMLAIASIKAHRNRDNIAAHQELGRLIMAVKHAIGEDSYQAIIHSPEWEQLYRVNDEMYIRIDELKQRPVTAEDALYIDNRVYARFKAKQALQQRWFPDQPLTETKHGYTTP